MSKLNRVLENKLPSIKEIEKDIVANIIIISN